MDNKISVITSTEEHFKQLKECFHQLVEENVKTKQNIGFIEDNKDWSKEYVQQLRQQLSELKTCVQRQHQSLKGFNEMKETINELKEKLRQTEQMNEELVDKSKSDMDCLKTEMKTNLEAKDNELKDLRLTISSKDILLSQTRRELSENKTKYEDNVNEIKAFYENEIKCKDKEFDNKCEDINTTNDLKIIDIKANCLMTVEKTKQELESKLIKCQNDYKELNEKYSDLRLESEARKMSNRFLNTNKCIAKSVNNNTNDNRNRLSIQVLDIEGNTSTVHMTSPIGHKRKKLIQSNDSYIEYLREEQ